MSELRDLYQEMILDHHRRPRNFRALPAPTRSAEGYNPLCGDRVTVQLDVGDGVVRDIGFQGSGCAISKASASMMTASLKGKPLGEAEQIIERFHAMLTALAGVREFPSRVKCAVLAWHTARAALAGKAEAITTE